MSPAKSKVPSSPPKKSKQPADDTTSPATPARRKSTKTGDAVDTANAVSTGLSAPDDTPAPAPMAPAVPKVSRAKTKAPAPDTAAKGGGSGAASSSGAGAPAAADMKTKGSSAGAGMADGGSTAKDSGAQPAAGSAQKSGVDLPGKASDLQSQQADAKAMPTATSPAAAAPSPAADAKASPATSTGAASEAPRTPGPQSTPAVSDAGAKVSELAPAPSIPSVPAAAASDKALELPKGALIAYRKSGGLKFSSREVVVYPDGRVTFDGGDTAKSALTRAARRMSDAQIMRLRRTLDQINFFGMKPPPSAPDPDGYVIEIAARLGSRNNRLQVNAAGLSGGLSSLVDQLTQLLPDEA